MNHFRTGAALSQKTAAVEEAAIIRMAQKARELKANGRDIVSLTIGEPDFDTPAHIRAAAKQALDDGETHYGPMAGLPQLRQAIAGKLKAENGLDYGPAEIVVSNGAKQAITNAVFALVDPGDEVILLAPYWVAYEGIIRFAGGEVKVVRSGPNENYKAPAAHIARAMSERTKLVIVNSPSNPTGAVFTRYELQAIANVVRAHPQAMVLADEIYEYITFEEPAVSIGSLPGMKGRTITVNGLSKGFAMTGWRIGYAAAPEPVARAMQKVQGAFTAGANPFAQRGAIAALEGGREEVTAMRDSYRRRRDLAVSLLSAIDGVEVMAPAGTFYIFPDVSAHLGRVFGNRRIDTVDELCDWLLEDHGVALVPGSAFGEDRAVRISFAASDEAIREGIARMAGALAA